MRRLLIGLLSGVLLVGLAPAALAHYPGEHTNQDFLRLLSVDQTRSSGNVRLVGNYNDKGTWRQGSDLAFWGKRAIAGNYDNPGGFYVLDISRPSRPREVGQFACAGPQADVSIWQKLVFVSVDTPRKGPNCNETESQAAPASQYAAGEAWEGIRIVSIANPKKPRQVATVDTDCGSHTHTIIPDLRHRRKGKAYPRVLIYVLSYPISGQGVECNVETHRKISVVEVPVKAPGKARVLRTPDVSPAIGCHDVTVFRPGKLAAAACITESQIWDISRPAKPKIVSHIRNPAMNIHHSSTWSWDGKTVVLGDEVGGAAVSPGCDGRAPTGALWFYDVSNPAAPQMKSYFKIPQTVPDTILCTAHNFNTVPLKTGRDILVSAWYNGGTTIVDFTKPSKPKQLGFIIPHDSRGRTAAWSSYFYNGYIYANNFDEDVNSLTKKSRGFDVYKINHRALRSFKEVSRLNPQTMEHAAVRRR